MQSSEITEKHIGGAFAAAISGTITGFQRDHDHGWTEVNVDVGLPGGSVIQMRFVDTDPIEIVAEEAGQPLNPAPEPVGEDDEGNPVWPSPSADPDDIDTEPGAGE